MVSEEFEEYGLISLTQEDKQKIDNAIKVKTLGDFGGVVNILLGKGVSKECIEDYLNELVYIIIEKGSNFYMKSIPLRKDFKGTKNA